MGPVLHLQSAKLMDSSALLIPITLLISDLNTNISKKWMVNSNNEYQREREREREKPSAHQQHGEKCQALADCSLLRWTCQWSRGGVVFWHRLYNPFCPPNTTMRCIAAWYHIHRLEEIQIEER